VRPFGQQRLKTLRVVIAIAFFIPVSILFLDISNKVPPEASALVVSVQFGPALMKILVWAGIYSFGLILVLAATAAFGRVYCSTVCPLGTLQDIVIRVSKKFRRRKRFGYRKPPYLLHYTLLAATAVLAAAGSMILVNLLEHL